MNLLISLAINFKYHMKQPLNFAIIGCGLFAETYLIPAFKITKNAKLIAITKQDAVKAQDFANKNNILHGFAATDIDNMYRDLPIDAVYIATPNSLHKKDAINALNAGKHVLLEKPMAMNAQECREINAVAEQNGKKLMIAHCLRYTSTVQFIKNQILEGKLGELITCTADFYSNGFASKRKWKFEKEIAGGGAAFDLGVHMVDTLRFLVDKPIKNVSCFTKPEKVPSDEVDLAASFLLHFEGDTLGRASATYQGSRNTYLEILGTRGYIRAFDWNLPNHDVNIEINLDGKFEKIIIHNIDNYASEIDAFANCILNNTSEPISGMDGLINQEIIDLVNR